MVVFFTYLGWSKLLPPSIENWNEATVHIKYRALLLFLDVPVKWNIDFAF